MSSNINDAAAFPTKNGQNQPPILEAEIGGLVLAIFQAQAPATPALCPPPLPSSLPSPPKDRPTERAPFTPLAGCGAG